MATHASYLFLNLRYFYLNEKIILANKKKYSLFRNDYHFEFRVKCDQLDVPGSNGNILLYFPAYYFTDNLFNKQMNRWINIMLLASRVGFKIVLVCFDDSRDDGVLWRMKVV